MKDLFICLLLNLTRHGNVSEATMYQGGTFSILKIETENGTYSVSISKEEEKKKNA